MTIRHLDALLRPDAVVVVRAPGMASSAAAVQMIEHLRSSSGIRLVETDARLGAWPAGAQRIAALIANPALTPETLFARLAGQGCKALLWPEVTAPTTSQMAEIRRLGLRLLGPRSGGIANPSLSFSATGFPCAPAGGTLALIAQSQSIAAAALDWAAGRNLGFSWVAITGAEADVDVADLLDQAALDPLTRSVVLQLSSIRSGRKFMSAARACARVKPVVVLQSQPAARIGGGPDPVRSAAFARAGLVECDSLPGLFDALAALQRLPTIVQASAVVVGNGAGICALGVDALARQGFVALPPGTVVREGLPPFRDAGGALDFGSATATQLALALRQLLADTELPALLLLHSPGAGSSHQALAELLTVAPDPRLLTVWLGLSTAMPARAACAQAGLATFTSANAAARALRYRWEYHRNRELLTQTPPPQRLPSSDPAALRLSLRQLALDDERMPATRLKDLLAAYGIPPGPENVGLRLHLKVGSHVELGQHFELSRGDAAPAFAFAPLDLLLAGRLLEQIGIAPAQAESATLSALLVQLAQLLIDQPPLLSLALQITAAGHQAGWLSAGAELRLQTEEPAERQRLVLAPYPAELCAVVEDSSHRRYRLRPVHPADEPSLIALLQKLDPEEVRMRFFAQIRHFSHAMGARMSQIDYDREISLVLIPEQSPTDEVVAIGTLIADPDNRSAEFALLVHHDHARSGLGSLLLRRLLSRAWQRGVGQVYGTVLAENDAMLTTARRLGFSQRREPDEPGCQRVEINAPDR